MKKILLFTAVLLALAACDKNDDNPAPSSGAIKITATIGESLTRASEDSWKENDEIGISSTVGSVSGPYINVKYTAQEEGKEVKFEGSPILFYSSMTLTAYYPFTGKEGEAPGNDNDGFISATTNAEAQEKLSKIDFLWDRQTGFTAAEPNVKFNFAHKMSKVTFTFQGSEPRYDEETGILLADGVDARTMVSYGIEKLGIEGTFDTATGVCAINENKHDGLTITFGMDYKSVENKYTYKRSFDPLIVFPQTLNEGKVTLHIYTDELNYEEDKGHQRQHYKCMLTFSNGEINPGCHYKYEIKVTKTGLIVGEMTVEKWDEEQRFLTATIDGNGFKEQPNTDQ